jgi:hypothetical protein
MAGNELDELIARGWLLRFIESGFAKWIALIGSISALLLTPFAFDPVQRAFFERTDFALELVSEIPIFDINRQLEGLQVQFQGQDLTASHQGVVVSQVQLRNIGDVAVTPQRTTELDPIGFAIKGGTLVRVTRVSASSPHLRSHLAPTRRGNQITINQGLIFEPGDFVRFDLLITRPLNGAVSYEPLGKIEGVRSIAYRTPSSQVRQRSFIGQTFAGSALVQGVRIFAYGFAAIGLLLLLLLGGIRISEARSDRRLKRRSLLVKAVAERSTKSTLAIWEVWAETFIRTGPRGLSSLEKRLRERELEIPERAEFIFPADVDVPDPIYRSYIDREPFSTALGKLEQLHLIDREKKTVEPKTIESIEKFRAAIEAEAARRRISLAKIES